MRLTDKQIDGLLGERWIADGGEPDDGYKMADIRRILGLVRQHIEALDDVLVRSHPTACKVDLRALEKAMRKLTDHPYDKKHSDFCWPDIFDSIEEVLEVAEKKRTSR